MPRLRSMLQTRIDAGRNRMQAADGTESDQLAFGFVACTSRTPTAEELRRSRDFLTAADAALASDVADPEERNAQAWCLLAQTLFMSSEFIYLR